MRRVLGYPAPGGPHAQPLWGSQGGTLEGLTAVPPAQVYSNQASPSVPKVPHCGQAEKERCKQVVISQTDYLLSQSTEVIPDTATNNRPDIPDAHLEQTVKLKELS